MADFPGVTGRSYTVASLVMRINGDTLKLREVGLGGREVTQEHVFEVGRRVAVAIVTGPEKPRELSVTVDPVSFSNWIAQQSALAVARPTITAVLTEPGLPSVTLDYEDCGFMGEELPSLKAGEATEFNVPTKWLPSRMKINGKYLSE